MIDLRFQPMKDMVKDPLKRTHYRASPFRKTIGAGYDDLERELKFLEATDIVIESGHSRTDIRNDGWPSSAAKPAHHAIRIFFNCKHGRLRYECDAFGDWRANIRAIGLWMQRQRLAIEEWGIGTGGEAYRGFAALPPGRTESGAIAAPEFASAEDAARFIVATAIAPKVPSGTDVELALKHESLMRAWFTDASKRSHPDTGGNTETMSKLNRARDFIEAQRSQP